MIVLIDRQIGWLMRFYIKIPQIGAVYCEITTLLGNKHLCSYNKLDKDYILDLPWTEIIFTPWSVLQKEKTHYNNLLLRDEEHGRPNFPTTKSEQRNTKEPAKRAPLGTVTPFPLHRP